MLTWLLEQLAFFGALSAVIIALLWPHVRPILPILQQKLLKPLNVILDLRFKENKRTNIFQDHPKFNGHKLKRMTSQKETIRSTYRSAGGFVQSPVAGADPSYARGLRLEAGEPNVPSHVGGASIYSSNNQSSTFLTLFTASIVALIIYTMMRMLSARFGGLEQTTNHNDKSRYWKPTGKGSNGSNPLGGLKDRKRLVRMKREERVRELFLLHGGRNVSNAIKFLVAELEKQKQLLNESLLSENLPATYACTCTSECAMTGQTHSKSPTADTKSSPPPSPSQVDSEVVSREQDDH